MDEMKQSPNVRPLPSSPMTQPAEAPRRKRKSRFSDAPSTPAAPRATSSDAETGPTVAVDPSALARAAAAKIARAIPGSTASVPMSATMLRTTTAPSDPDELRRFEQEKRRRTDQIYKSVQSQMSHIKALLRKPEASTAGAVAAAAGDVQRGAASGSVFMPAPLLLDEHGREIDAAGNVVADKPTVASVAMLKANQKGAKRADGAKTKNQNPYLSHRTVDDKDKMETVDPRLKTTKRETFVTGLVLQRIECVWWTWF